MLGPKLLFFKQLSSKRLLNKSCEYWSLLLLHHEVLGHPCTLDIFLGCDGKGWSSRVSLSELLRYRFVMKKLGLSSGWLASEIVHSTFAKELAVEVRDPVSLSLVQQTIKLVFSAGNILFTSWLCSKSKKGDIEAEEIKEHWWPKLVAASGGALFVGIVRLLGKVLNQKALVTVTMSFINTVTVWRGGIALTSRLQVPCLLWFYHISFWGRDQLKL